ncbi:hypothetical protein ACFV3R_03975 [Streptomyces sp. NPDC059740]|uniref:hypothetical protein n=1 Tax=Streptomyces sp. NPDC059740 TaxID=3346926 RepID=UPI00365A0C66
MTERHIPSARPGSRLQLAGRAAGHGHPHRPRAVAPASQACAYVTLAGAEWLASASDRPGAVRQAWLDRPTVPAVLPCGREFDVVSAPLVFGSALVDRLWSDGPGSGPVAVHRGRVLVFTAPGTASRLPALLRWLTAPVTGSARTAAGPPPVLCHGRGDAVTLPALYPEPADEEYRGPATPLASRWLVAPEVRTPWLPGPEALLWACVRTARPGGLAGRGQEDGVTVA